jgi:hypothetical protein
MQLACWSFFIKEQGPHVLLEIVGVTGHLPYYLTALVDRHCGRAGSIPTCSEWGIVRLGWRKGRDA